MNTLLARAVRARSLKIGAASLASLAVLGASSATAAAPNSPYGNVEVVNTETVKAYLSSTGSVESSRVYEQLSMTGQGSVTIENPIEESGLRNLDGFGGYQVTDGVQTTSVDVDGTQRLRSVSNYTRDLPLEVSVDYLLDGEDVEPGDVVGAAGALTVTYTVKNVTAAPQEITYTDGSGGTVTETAEVPIPMVGSLSTVAPENFTDVHSDSANMAGDGEGGTKLSFTMTLFPPVGSDTATFGYTANIEDGVVPSAAITALPVNPMDSPTFKSAGDSYKGGSETGEKLVAGANEIDANLLRLRDGAAELLAGLIQLSDGADELQAGLADEAVPGAAKLAAGAGDLNDGIGKIDAGAGKLDAGAKKLKGGTSSALAGGQQLSAGLQQISGGLDQLADSTSGLPAASAGIDALQAGVDQLVAGFGTTSQAGTLLNGLDQLETGLGALKTGSATLQGGLVQLRGDGSAATPGLVAAKGGVDQVQAGLGKAVAPGGSLDQLIGALNGMSGHPTDCIGSCPPTLKALAAAAAQSKADLTAGNAGLLQVSGGLGQAIGGLNTQLIPGAGQLTAGLTDAAAGATKAKAGAGQLKAGVLQVSDGLDQLEAGVASAVGGVLQLANGAQTANTGSGDLAAGLGQLDAGAGELSAGTGELAAGTGAAADGAGQLADGAGQLSSGLGAAADGSGLLADGLDQAAAGAPALVDGAGRLSTEGMSQLVEAGTETAQDYGKLYSVLEAGSERADAEKMAYGAPVQAMGLTAYSFEIAGADGEGSRNMQRGLGALVVMGAGLGALGLRRRLTA